MAEISDDEVIALAKALLRQTILASGWYPSPGDNLVVAFGSNIRVVSRPDLRHLFS